MAILLTNGKYYIAHNRTGAVIKVAEIEQAQDFYSVERAAAQKKKTPGKCASYYYIDTDKMKTVQRDVDGKTEQKKKHKIFTMQERWEIYQKTGGHCYLCGGFVDFDSFEVEHYVPVSKGGTNEMDNLFCSHRCCNIIKHDLYFEDFLKKITQIFMYQMKNRMGDSAGWEKIRKLLGKGA